MAIGIGRERKTTGRRQAGLRQAGKICGLGPNPFGIDGKWIVEWEDKGPCSRYFLSWPGLSRPYRLGEFRFNVSFETPGGLAFGSPQPGFGQVAEVISHDPHTPGADQRL